jgi:Flp pilus assembly protein TadG
MTIRGIPESLHRLWRRFRQHEGGNVAIIFGLAVIPLAGFVGASIDYTRASSARVAMQSAVDSAALMLSKELAKEPTMATGTATQKANDYFNALFTHPEALSKQLTLTFDIPTSTVTMSANAVVNTTFSRIIGKNQFAISTSTTAKWGMTRLRVALALDTTGSMSSAGKIEALKTATKSLLTILKNAAAQNGDVYVSIVPFSRDVNLDSSNYNGTYIDWTAWEAPPANGTPSETRGPGTNCPYKNDDEGYRCTGGPANEPNCNTGNDNACVSTIPSSGTYAGYICPSLDTGAVNQRRAGVYYNGCYDSQPKPQSDWKEIETGSNASCGSTPNCSCAGSGSNKVCKQTTYYHNWIKNARSTWNGCVNDRGNTNGPHSSNYDQNVDAPSAGNAATLFSAEQYYLCAPAMKGLGYDWTTMNTMVDNLYPAGSTNQPIGLVWGWQSLVGGGPLTAPAKDPLYKYTEIVILLSDGLNTQDRWYGNGWQTSSSVDNRMLSPNATTGVGTCKNIKDSGVVIFTVHVNTDGDPMSTLLQNCASPDATEPPGKKFFHLTTSGEIVDTFKIIGTNLARLRIAK